MLEKQVLKRRARTSQSKVRTDSLNYLVKAFCVTFSHFYDNFFFCLFVLQAWLLWKKMHRFALYQRKKEEKANLYAIQRLKRKSMCLWKSYTSFRQTKKNSQGFYASFLFVLNAKSEFLSYLWLYFLAVAQHAHRLHLLRKSWHKWINALSIKRRDEIHMEAASLWAVRSTQRRTIALWKACILYIKLSISMSG